MATHTPVHKTAYLDLDLDDALARVDFDKVHHAVETTAGYVDLGASERAEVKELVWLAAETWLAHDLQEFDDPEFELAVADGKAIIDLRATMRGTMQPYAAFGGKQIIIDWKTTNSNVDTDEWRNRCLDSWQWKIYLSLSPEAKVFNYRGISRLRGSTRFSGGEPAAEACRTRNVMLESNDGLVEEVREQKRGVIAMYNSLVDANLLVWPRNTKSCYAFGKRCAFKRDCDSNQMPLGTVADRAEDLSHSRMDALMLCPERLRRSKLVNIDDIVGDSSDATVVGGAFHAGVAALWAEAFRVRG